MIKTRVPCKHRHQPGKRSRSGRLGEEVSELVLGGNIHHRYQSPLNQILNNHKPQLKVLRTISELTGVVSELARGGIVLVGANDMGSNPDLSEQLARPQARLCQGKERAS